MADQLSTAAVMVKYLGAAGIRHIFGYPGTPNLDFIEVARQEGFELVAARREGTAAFMAEAYGWLTGRPGVCLSTLGPGSTALLNGVACANLDRVPMIALSGQVSNQREPYFTHQVVDHNRLYAPITKWATRIVPESAAAVMRKALRVATAERPGAVHISASADVLRVSASDNEVALPPSAAIQHPQVFGDAPADPEPVKLLTKSRRPMVLAGMAALRSHCTADLVQFAERVGCPVVVSPMAKGVFPEDHPLYAGILDMACNKIVWAFLAQADLLLLVGFDAVELIQDWSLKAPAIHIDAVPNTDQIYSAAVELVGHIPGILRSYAQAFRGEPRWDPKAVASHREALRQGYYAGRVAGKLNPTDVVDALNQAFPPSTVVTTDIGSHKLLVAQGWRATEPNGFLSSNGLSAMGFALPAAFTAKLLDRSRPVVCTVGDGGFAMVAGEMRVASELGLGVVVVVFCDNSLNRIELKQIRKHYPPAMTRIAPTDLVGLARAMECDGVRVETPQQAVDALAGAAGKRDRPLIVEAVIDPAQYEAQF